VEDVGVAKVVVDGAVMVVVDAACSRPVMVPDEHAVTNNAVAIAIIPDFIICGISIRRPEHVTP